MTAEIGKPSRAARSVRSTRSGAPPERFGLGSVPDALRACASVDHVRVRRLRAAGALLPLDPRRSLPPDQDHVRLRSQQDLRAGHQQPIRPHAFLLENNSVLQNKLVVAHVLGHSDFFKHNAYFGHTNREDARNGQRACRSHPPVRVRPRQETRWRVSWTRSSRSRSTSILVHRASSRTTRSTTRQQRPACPLDLR